MKENDIIAGSIRSVDELPEPDSSHMEAFREEAEEEISSKLDI